MVNGWLIMVNSGYQWMINGFQGWLIVVNIMVNSGYQWMINGFHGWLIIG